MYAYARRHNLHALINNRQECEQTHCFSSALNGEDMYWEEMDKKKKKNRNVMFIVRNEDPSSKNEKKNMHATYAGYLNLSMFSCEFFFLEKEEKNKI